MVTLINILFKINLGTQEHKCFLPSVSDKNRTMFTQRDILDTFGIFCPDCHFLGDYYFFSGKVADSHKYCFILIRETVIAIVGVDLVWKREILQLPGTQNETISRLLRLSLTKPSAAGGAAWPSEIVWFPKSVWWLQTRAVAVPLSLGFFSCVSLGALQAGLCQSRNSNCFPFVKVVSFNTGPK